MTDTATKQYFRSMIADATQKALNITVKEVRLEEGKVLVELDLGAGEGPFWDAVKEQV